MTASKFSAELTSIVTDKLQISPDECVDVIVFLEEDAILEKVIAELEAKGLRIRTVNEGPDVLIKGSIEVERLLELNAVAEVYRIEYNRSIEAK
ncbi:MAG TPA: hypothetical protein VN278_04095 [Methanosarcina sp.]|nr:hypothetical protein [Methanosarcina sp.]